LNRFAIPFGNYFSVPLQSEAPTERRPPLEISELPNNAAPEPQSACLQTKSTFDFSDEVLSVILSSSFALKLYLQIIHRIRRVMSKPAKTTIEVQGTAITVVSNQDEDYISLTDMLKAKDGDFFISDWLRNRNTVEFLGIWESVYNPAFNYGEFATIKSQAGLNSYKLSVKDWKATCATTPP